MFEHQTRGLKEDFYTQKRNEQYLKLKYYQDQNVSILFDYIAEKIINLLKGKKLHEKIRDTKINIASAKSGSCNRNVSRLLR